MQTLTAVGAVAAVIGAIHTIEKYALRIVRIAKRFTGDDARGRAISDHSGNIG